MTNNEVKKLSKLLSAKAAEQNEQNVVNQEVWSSEVLHSEHKANLLPALNHRIFKAPVQPGDYLKRHEAFSLSIEKERRVYARNWCETGYVELVALLEAQGFDTSNPDLVHSILTSLITTGVQTPEVQK